MNTENSPTMPQFFVGICYLINEADKYKLSFLVEKLTTILMCFRGQSVKNISDDIHVLSGVDFCMAINLLSNCDTIQRHSKIKIISHVSALESKRLSLPKENI